MFFVNIIKITERSRTETLTITCSIHFIFYVLAKIMILNIIIQCGRQFLRLEKNANFLKIVCGLEKC
jgi:hypothetical protein